MINLFLYWICCSLPPLLTLVEHHNFHLLKFWITQLCLLIFLLNCPLDKNSLFTWPISVTSVSIEDNFLCDATCSKSLNILLKIVSVKFLILYLLWTIKGNHNLLDSHLPVNVLLKCLLFSINSKINVLLLPCLLQTIFCISCLQEFRRTVWSIYQPINLPLLFGKFLEILINLNWLKISQCFLYRQVSWLSLL